MFGITNRFIQAQTITTIAVSPSPTLTVIAIIAGIFYFMKYKRKYLLAFGSLKGFNFAQYTLTDD
jgi:hypothetical protein